MVYSTQPAIFFISVLDVFSDAKTFVRFRPFEPLVSLPNVPDLSCSGSGGRVEK